MRIAQVLAVLCACALTCDADKFRLLNKFRGRHHKRGIWSAVPPYKVGYDLPIVSHSVLKPILVRYPPTAIPLAVKIPLTPPTRIPLPPGHESPHGHKTPHTNTVLVQRPENHFHHHHHHVVPAVPVPPPVIPVPAPSVPVATPVPAPPPVIVRPTQVLPVRVPVFPPPAFRPVFHPSPAPVFPAPVLPAPVFPAPAAPVNYVIRPGNAVQTSYFATYPRYPFAGFARPILPVHGVPLSPGLGPLAPGVPQFASSPVFLDRPAQVPHFHHASPVPLAPAPVSVEQAGCSPILHHHEAAPTPHLVPEHTQVTQEQVPQVYEEHTGDSEHQYQHELHHQIQQQIQHQLEHEHQFQQHQHQLQQQQHQHQIQQQQHQHQEYETPQQEYGAPVHEYTQEQHDYQQVQQDYQAQQEYHAQQEYQAQQQLHAQQQQYHQPHQEYGAPQQISSEYGVPGPEGRSSEHEEEDELQLKYHNHIPLGLQPPIDRPLEHF